MKWCDNICENPELSCPVWQPLPISSRLLDINLIEIKSIEKKKSDLSANSFLPLICLMASSVCFKLSFLIFTERE